MDVVSVPLNDFDPREGGRDAGRDGERRRGEPSVWKVKLYKAFL